MSWDDTLAGLWPWAARHGSRRPCLWPADTYCGPPSVRRRIRIPNHSIGVERMSNENWKATLAGLVVLAAFGLICPLLAAPRVPLVDPDEGLHASIAQEMVERGDWIVPRQLQ